MTTSLDGRPPFRAEPPPRMSDAELQQRHQQAFPEALGPGQDTESGAVSYEQQPDPRIGAIPHLIDPETRDRENRERQERLAALSPLERQVRADVEAIVRDEMRRR